MGNKSTFVFLFFVFGIVFQFQSVAFANCTKQNLSGCKSMNACNGVGGAWSGMNMAGATCVAKKCSKEYFIGCKSEANCNGVGGKWDGNSCGFPDSNLNEVIVTSGKTSETKCKEAGGLWDDAAKSCNLNGFDCPKGKGINECLKNADAAKSACINVDGGEWDSANKKCIPKASDAANAKCGPHTTGEKPHAVGTDNPTAHNDCTCRFKNKQGILGTYVAGNTVKQTEANCPEKDETGEAVVTENEADAEGLDCIQDIRNDINACKAASSKSVKACDLKSEENAGTMQGATQLAQSSQQFMHASIAEQCTNMGLVTGATGMGLSAIQGTCNAEMKSCEDACSNVQDYTNANKIKAKCATAANEDANKLQEEANQLASVMRAANKECVTTSEELLKQVGSNLTSMVNGYRVAAQCENQVNSKPVLTQVNLNTCIASPNAAGCPVNCISNPTNAQCTCLSNPSAAGCQKGGGAEFAGGNPNGKIQYSPISGSGSFKPSAGGGGGGGGLDLDVDNEGNQVAVVPPEDGGKKESMFGQAAAAPGGSGGGGTGDGASGKPKGGAAADEEDKGLFGGVFQSLKSAAGSLFGSGSGGSKSAAKKTADGKEAGFNAAGLKPISGNKNLRGLASSGNVCFVDTKGTRVCFGTKNEDIWMKMQKQYSLQYNTFITDK